MTYPTPETVFTISPIGPGQPIRFAEASVMLWLDQNNTVGGAAGTLVPPCEGAPLPVSVVGGSSGGTFTDASVAPDGPSAAQPTSATQLGFWNGTGYVPVQTGAGLPVTDTNSASVFGVVPITPGTAITPLRGIAFICTAAGNITLTLADASTMTFPIAAGPALQVLGFSVGNITLGTGTAGTFWGTK